MSGDDTLKTLATIARHRDLVRLAISVVTDALARRGLVHDLSKYEAHEIEGFCRINRIAREHAYGSDEYRQSMKQEAETIALHYFRNSHHPEHHEIPEWAKGSMWRAETMGLLDLIEMVCDWRGAYLAYGSQGSWEENMQRQHDRYAEWFSKGQWWVIDEMGKILANVKAGGGR